MVDFKRFLGITAGKNASASKEGPDKEDKIQLTITECTFSGGQSLKLNTSDIVVIVGPNNSGKSAALRNLLRQLENTKQDTEVITKVSFDKRGSVDDLTQWVEKHCHRDGQRINHLGQEGYTFTMIADWTDAEQKGLGALAKIFCAHITVEKRLTATANITLPDTLTQGDSHPTHRLYRSATMTEDLSRLFNKAFDEHLIVNTRSGSRLRIHITPVSEHQSVWGSRE